MIFSKTCQYSINAMIYLTRYGFTDSGNKRYKASGKQIAHGTDAPEFFTSKVLQNLARYSLISSLQGPNGGFSIVKNPSEISLYDVLVTIDGDQFSSRCVLGLDPCSDTLPCPLHEQFKDIRRQTRTMLINTSIQDLADAPDLLFDNDMYNTIPR